ncbi:MAG: hypothetical protein FWE38_02970 [Firmicutes bacterium]|nr:hypothetical protein [Bacillota bacterium]
MEQTQTPDDAAKKQREDAILHTLHQFVMPQIGGIDVREGPPFLKKIMDYMMRPNSQDVNTESFKNEAGINHLSDDNLMELFDKMKQGLGTDSRNLDQYKQHLEIDQNLNVPSTLILDKLGKAHEHFKGEVEKRKEMAAAAGAMVKAGATKVAKAGASALKFGTHMAGRFFGQNQNQSQTQTMQQRTATAPILDTEQTQTELEQQTPDLEIEQTNEQQLDQPELTIDAETEITAELENEMETPAAEIEREELATEIPDNVIDARDMFAQRGTPAAERKTDDLAALGGSPMLAAIRNATRSHEMEGEMTPITPQNQFARTNDDLQRIA